LPLINFTTKKDSIRNSHVHWYQRKTKQIEYPGLAKTINLHRIYQYHINNKVEPATIQTIEIENK